MNQRRVIEIPAKVEKKYESSKRQLRVAAYCRVSTELEAQQNSFQAQKDYYTAKIAENQEWTLAGIFADEGVSGTSVTGREGFQKMLRYCEQGKIDLIITKSITRFSRNIVDCLLVVRQLQDLRIPVIFEAENINTGTMESEFILALMGTFSQAESEAISNRVKWGIRESFRSGNPRYYYKTWLGYRKGEDGKPEIVPEEAEIVNLVFSLFLDGGSLRSIADELNRKGIRTKGEDKEWRATGIKQILCNEKYAGDVLLQKTYSSGPFESRRKNQGELPMYLVENAHPAIISRDTFQWAQEELKRRSALQDTKVAVVGEETRRKYSSKYAVSEILVCGECNTLYRRCTWLSKGKKKIVWRCINRLKYGTKYCHNSPSISEIHLHQALVNAINKMLYHPDYLLAPFDKTVVRSVAPVGNRAEFYENLRLLQNALDEDVVDLIVQCAQEGNWENHRRKFECLLEEWGEHQEAIESLELEQYAPEYYKKQHWLPYQLTEYSDSIVRKVVDTVKVIDGDKLQVIFKSGYSIEQEIPK